MAGRGVAVLQRPAPPTLRGQAGANSTLVGSNLYPLERQGNVEVHSYFLHYADENLGWKDKLLSIADIVADQPPFSWLLDSSGGVLYTVHAVTPGEYTRERCRVAQGPRVASDLLSIESVCRMIFSRINSNNRRNREIEIQIDQEKEEWIKIQLNEGILALSISPSNGFEETFSNKTLLEVFLSHGSDSGKMNHWIARQREACIKVACDHYDGDKRIGYSVVRLSEKPASKQILEIDGNSLFLVDYFANTLPGFKQWIVKLKYPHLPLAVDVKGRFLPLELCRVKESKTRRNGATIVSEVVNFANPLSEHILVKCLSEFGISLKLDKHLEARARLLPPSPNRTLPLVNRDSGCAVISFLSDNKNLDHLLARLLAACRDRIKLRFASDKVHVIRIAHDAVSWEKDFKNSLSNILIQPEIFFVVSDGQLGEETHDRLKVVLDLKLRVPSQFITIETFTSKISCGSYWDSLLQQIALKIGPEIPSAKPSGTVIGSVWVQPVVASRKIKALALSLSYDNSMSMFTTQARLAIQTNQFDFSEIFYHALLDWFQKCKCFPNRLIMFLQHPEESRVFSTVADILGGAKSATSRVNRELQTGINIKLGTGPPISPNWTFILTSKKSGVLVKAPLHDIAVNSNFIASHGVEFIIKPANSARSTKYSVIHDTNNFTVSELENFTHQISTPGAGYPVPVKHASKVVQRMNLYISSELKDAHLLDENEKIQLLNQKLFDPDIALFNATCANYL